MKSENEKLPTMAEIRKDCPLFFENAKFHKTVKYSKKGRVLTCHNVGYDSFYYILSRPEGISLQCISKEKSGLYYFYDDTVKVYVDLEKGMIVDKAEAIHSAI